MVLLLAATLAGSASGADPCVVGMAETDARGVALVTAECHWPVSHLRLLEILRDQDAIDDVLSSVSESRVLADGRVLQVHSMGLGIAARQVTPVFRAEPLEDLGMRLRFQRAETQEPLAEGRVEILVDVGHWQVVSDGAGGARLHYAVRYDAGGRLEPWILRRFLRAGVSKTLAELRRAAQLPARVGLGLE